MLAPSSYLFPAEGLKGGDEDEPVLEQVGEEEQDLAVAGELEGDEADKAEGED